MMIENPLHVATLLALTTLFIFALGRLTKLIDEDVKARQAAPVEATLEAVIARYRARHASPLTHSARRWND